MAIAPMLTPAWELGSGTPLPFIAPALAVVLLLLSPQLPPPPALLVRLLAILVGITAGLAWVGAAVADNPLSLWLGLLALFTACFARLARRPQDILANLAVMVAAIVVVLLQVSAELPPILPWLMTRAFLLAAAVTLVAHALLPGPPAAGAAPAPPQPGPGEDLRALGKALALLAAIGACILTGDTSAVLIAITVANVLRMPDRAAGLSFGQVAVLGNLLAAAVVAPTLLLLALQAGTTLAAMAALAGALAVAGGLGRGGRGAMLAQVAMPVVVVMLGLYAPQVGDGAGAGTLDRLASLALAVAYGTAVHFLLARPASNAGEGDAAPAAG